LSDSFGGSSSSFFGTRGAVYLVRATAVSAAVFMLTSLTLAFLSVRRGRSLMEQVKVERVSEPGPGTGGQEKP
jgi:preprotein translocase subunit SecG